MSQRPSILQLDLRLRAEYPDLNTKIFELSPYHHLIVVPPSQLDANAFKKEFEDKWRTIGDRVEISNTEPETATLVEGLNDRDIGKDISGLFANRHDLQVRLAGLFPNLPALLEIRDGSDHKLYFGFESLPSSEESSPVHEFLAKSLQGREYEFEVVSGPEPTPEDLDPRVAALLPENDPLNFKPINQRPKVPEFVQEEEYQWFSRLPDLYSGQASAREFRHSLAKDDEIACYMHSTVGQQIDLRQLLLAFDVVYLEPPLLSGPKDVTSFWSDNQIAQDDLVRAVEAGRVRIVHSQAEERGDLGLLREMHEANPNGVDLLP